MELKLLKCDAEIGLGYGAELDCILPHGHAEGSTPTPHLDRNGIWWLRATDEDLAPHLSPDHYLRQHAQ